MTRLGVGVFSSKTIFYIFPAIRIECAEKVFCVSIHLFHVGLFFISDEVKQT